MVHNFLPSIIPKVKNLFFRIILPPKIKNRIAVFYLYCVALAKQCLYHISDPALRGSDIWRRFLKTNYHYVTLAK
jgi:hypothetical protein